MFQLIINYILSYEGGFTNNPQDAGGETNYGITKKLYENVRPDGDFDSIDVEEAKDIYKTTFYKKEYYDIIDPSLSLVFMDTVVNHGNGKGTRMIQKSLGVVADGIYGDKTSRAAQMCDPPIVILYLVKLRKKRMIGHPLIDGLLNRLLTLQCDSLNLYYSRSLVNIGNEDGRLDGGWSDNGSDSGITGSDEGSDIEDTGTETGRE